MWIATRIANDLKEAVTGGIDMYEAEASIT
jgi:hypothetical protein